MPQTLTSPVKKYPGTVTLPDALTFPQYQAWSAAIRQYTALGDAPTVTDMDAAFVPGILACVTAWDIPALADFVRAGQLPATPRTASHALIMWLIGAITALVREADDDDPKD